MRIAYLLSAYTDPPHLARLVAALSGEADFFVHVDRRVDEQPFRDALQGRTDVTFLPTRHAVLWGDITQVFYQRDLLRAALDTGRDYERLVLLSGTDYPLWSNAHIRSYFAAHAGRELMAGQDMTTLTHREAYFFRRRMPQTWLPGISERLNLKVRHALRSILWGVGVRKPLTLRVGRETWHVFHGSDYWAVTPRAARRMLATLQANPRLLRFFSTMFVPSETVWPTLLFNDASLAPRATLVPPPYRGLEALTPLHFIDYSDGIRVLTAADLPRLQSSGKMFCRKCITGRSDELMRLIDAQRAAEEARTAADETKIATDDKHSTQ